MNKLGVRLCAFCRKEFEPWRIDQRLCGRECHDLWFAEEKRRALAMYRQLRHPQMLVIEEEDEEKVA